VGPGGAATVGLDQRAVDVDVVVAGHLRGEQRRMQTRRRSSQRVDALVEIVVGGGPADRVVDGQLGDPGAVQKPADDQDRLFEAAQSAGAGAGPASLAFGVQPT
jgi:hypothetical protein